MPETKNGGLYYVRRGTKVFCLSAKKLLVSRTERKILKTDDIRPSGTSHWTNSQDFDWRRLMAQVLAEEAVFSENHATTTESTGSDDGKATDAESQTSQTTEASRSATAQHVQKSWWNDTSNDRANRGSRNGRLTTSLLGIGALGILAAVTSPRWGHLLPVAKQSISVQSDSTQNRQLFTVSSGHVESPRPTDVTSNPSNTATSAPLTEDESGVEQNIDTLSDASHLETVKTIEPSSDEGTQRSKAMKLEDFNRQVLDARSYNSKSEELAHKSEIDLLYDRTAAVVDFYLKASNELRSSQQQWFEVSKSIAELTSFVEAGNFILQNAPIEVEGLNSQIASCEFELKKSMVGREDVIVRRNHLCQLRADILNKIAAANTLLPTKRNELILKNKNLDRTELEIARWAGLESESLRSLLDQVDFFGENPREYHRRLHIQATTLASSNPDFLLSYLLKGISGIFIDEPLKSVEEDAMNLRRQISTIPPKMREVRQKLLGGFEMISLCMLAMAKLRANEAESAIKDMNIVKERAPYFSEGWLVRGVVIAHNAKAKDVRAAFDAAINHRQDDVRNYRITVRTLRQTSGITKQILHTYTSKLAEMSNLKDWQSWIEICRGLLAVGERERAREYYKEIERNSLNADELDRLGKELCLEDKQPTQ